MTTSIGYLSSAASTRSSSSDCTAEDGLSESWADDLCKIRTSSPVSSKDLSVLLTSPTDVSSNDVSTSEGESDSSIDLVGVSHLYSPSSHKTHVTGSVFAAAHEAFLRRKQEAAQNAAELQKKELSAEEMRVYRMQKQRYFRAINLVPKDSALPDTRRHRSRSSSPAMNSSISRRSPGRFFSPHRSPFDGFAPALAQEECDSVEEVDTEICLDRHLPSLVVRSAPIDIPPRRRAPSYFMMQFSSLLDSKVDIEEQNIDASPVLAPSSPLLIFDL